MSKIIDYMALAMQVPCYAVNKYPDRSAAMDSMEATIARIDKQIFNLSIQNRYEKLYCSPTI